MKTTSGSMAALLALTLYGTALLAQTASPATPAANSNESPVTTTEATSPSPEPVSRASSGSQVRIVRLSEVRGEVELDRSTERGFEAAYPNLPITEGSKLKTAQGVAEVEFEDNSTLRLTPNTLIEFHRLGRNSGGATASKVEVLKGTVYVSLANTKGNEFAVSFGDATATLPASSHIQLSVGAPATRLGVYEGNIQVANASGTTTVGKKKALLFDAANHAPPTLVSGVEKSSFDSWDKTSVQYHKSFANASAYGNTGSLYGLNDMSYYGSFFNDASCGGSMWRPYFASAAWEPYENGAYAWYPGAGYSWVSPYPWGWTPYHSGSWQYCPSRGWGWTPGGSWTGLTNTAQLGNPHAPSRPKLPAPPLRGHPTIVLVSTRPLAISKLDSSNNFVFHNDSAGLGVPRQIFGKLQGVSHQVTQNGSASTAIYRGTGITGGAGSGQQGQAGHSSLAPTRSQGVDNPGGIAHGSSVAGSSSLGSSSARSSSGAGTASGGGSGHH